MIRKFRSFLLVIGIGLAAVLLVYVLIQKNVSAKSSQNITTATVTKGTFIGVIESSGKIKADRTVDLKFQTAGKLVWVGVKEGDFVEAYHAIASLDKREVQKNLEKALRDYGSERNDFEEARTTTYGFKKPTDVNDTIKRIMEKNQWDLEKAVYDVELKSLALEFATLVTPISGIVTRIDTPVAGVNITPANAVFTVTDPQSLVFEANVDETDIAALTVGTLAKVSLDAYPETTFSGTISSIAYTAEQSAGGGTVFPVKIALTDPKYLRIGLNGDVTIETQRQESVLLVPPEAIREIKGQTVVYKKTGNTYTETPVTTGHKNEDVITITQGLAEGDIVVTKGFSGLAK